MLEVELPWLQDVVRAKPTRHLPVVLTHTEVRAVLAKLEDEHWLIGSILYGGGLRLQEALQLRVKDVDFDLRQFVIHAQHSQAMTRGHGGVEMPFALERKYPAAPLEWG